MAHDTKYGKIQIKGIGESEQIFILRGQDALAPTTILVYADLLDQIGRHKQARQCREAASSMAKYCTKLPD